MSLPKGANVKYSSKKELVEKYQSRLSKKDAENEQEWSDTYLALIIDFMGDENTWKFFLPDVEAIGFGGRRSSRKVPKNDKDVAVFSGSHWRARKAGKKDFFDPYDEYQVFGSNQFCQTFSMMYLEDKLPKKINGGWEKYYTYTKEALKYIKSKISKLEYEDGYEKVLLTAVNKCLSSSNACVNIIEYP